jgi:hypothetical protein
MQETTMTKNKFLYTRSIKHRNIVPFHIVVKQHKNRRILYVTYRGGKKSGGGAWSENLSNVHPRTYSMILEIFGEKVIEDLKDLALPYKKRSYRPNSSTKASPNEA